jgi:hypothetical protein
MTKGLDFIWQIQMHEPISIGFIKAIRSLLQYLIDISFTQNILSRLKARLLNRTQSWYTPLDRVLKQVVDFMNARSKPIGNIDPCYRFGLFTNHHPVRLKSIFDSDDGRLSIQLFDS